MTTGATAAAVPSVERTRPAIHRAGRVVAAGAAIGLAGQLLFFETAIGINAPIALALLLGAAWRHRRPGVGIRASDVWLAPAAVLFATFAAVRADRSIVTLDLLTALGLGGAALLAFGGREVVRSSVEPLLRQAATGIGWVLSGAVPALSQARRAIPSGSVRLAQLGPGLPVLRGLLIALPVLVVFVALFSAADAVFARIVDDVFSLHLDLGELPGRLVVAGVIAWVAAGALALVAAERRDLPEPAGSTQPAGRPHGWRLGTTESVTVLACVVAVFGLFVVLQAAYLFGGLDTLAATGIGYAEYARRGFFELVAVAILAGGLIVILDRTVRRRTRSMIAAALTLTALTGVVLASAAFRMRLYQEAYGWTELRLYVLATIVLLAVTLAILAGALLTDRVRWIGHAIVATGLAVGLALNLIGPVRFITEQNVARALDPDLVPARGASGLDSSYLGSLDLDAVPVLVDALPELGDAEAGRVRDELEWQLRVLRSEAGANTWQAWNVGRDTARNALERAVAGGQLDDR